MTSARSCKNPERTWFSEILRRCKALPALIAVAYFLSNILPILFSYNRLENVMMYAYGAMTGFNFFNVMISIIGGVAVSCAVFRYLHGTASVTDAHAMPLTRTQLFRGSFFAGLIIVIAPVVLTGLFYLCVMGAHCDADPALIMKSWEIAFDPEQILTVSHIAGWTLDNILLIGFAYCVACLAAVLAGTAVIQALLALFLISLPAMLYLVVQGYLGTFLYGYSGNVDISEYLSPYLHFMIRNDYPFSEVPVVLIIYAVISVLCALAAVFIYRRIKLENEERTIVVPVVSDILVIILTALAASTILFIIMNFSAVDSTAGAIITLILATAVFFPVFCMIADQSFRIFRKKNGGVLIAYAAVMCLLLAFTVFDVTGFEKRVPEVSEIQSADIVDSNLMKPEFKGCKDEEALTLLTDLHRSITMTEKEAKTADMEVINGQYENISGLTITYKLKNGKTLTRSYAATTRSAYEQYAAYYECEAVRKHECFDTEHPLKKGQYMSVIDTHVDEQGESIDNNSYRVPAEYEAGLLKAANKDIMKWTAENRRLFSGEEYDPKTDNSTYSINISVNYGLPQKQIDKLEPLSTCSMMTTDDTHTNAYIEDHPQIMAGQNIIPDDDPIYGISE